MKTFPWWLLGKSLKYRNWIGSFPKSEKFLELSNIYQAVLNFSEISVIVPDSCSLSQFRYSQVSNCKGIYQRKEGWAFGETKNSNNLTQINSQMLVGLLVKIRKYMASFWGEFWKLTIIATFVSSSFINYFQNVTLLIRCYEVKANWKVKANWYRVRFNFSKMIREFFQRK